MLLSVPEKNRQRCIALGLSLGRCFALHRFAPSLASRVAYSACGSRVLGNGGEVNPSKLLPLFTYHGIEYTTLVVVPVKRTDMLTAWSRQISGWFLMGCGKTPPCPKSHTIFAEVGPTTKGPSPALFSSLVCNRGFEFFYHTTKTLWFWDGGQGSVKANGSGLHPSSAMSASWRAGPQDGAGSGPADLFPRNPG